MPRGLRGVARGRAGGRLGAVLLAPLHACPLLRSQAPACRERLRLLRRTCCHPPPRAGGARGACGGWGPRQSGAALPPPPAGASGEDRASYPSSFSSLRAGSPRRVWQSLRFTVPLRSPRNLGPRHRAPRSLPDWRSPSPPSSVSFRPLPPGRAGGGRCGCLPA